jgi:Amt family ammonium transporter
MDIRAYFVYTIVISALIYPVVCHWAWNADGWATKMEIGDHTVGVIDFAGSGVVHMTGGMAGLVGAIVVGPRKYRFDAETVDEGTGNRVNWGGQNAAFQSLGTLIPWVGWYGFNCASTGAITDSGVVVGHIDMTTTISAAAGGAATIVSGRLVDGAWEPKNCSNGILGGLVAITAGCADVEAHGAF